MSPPLCTEGRHNLVFIFVLLLYHVYGLLGFRLCIIVLIMLLFFSQFCVCLVFMAIHFAIHPWLINAEWMPVNLGILYWFHECLLVLGLWLFIMSPLYRGGDMLVYL